MGFAPLNPSYELKKRKREKLEAELESGPEIDQRRDNIMRRMLQSPPKQQKEMKLGQRSKR